MVGTFTDGEGRPLTILNLFLRGGPDRDRYFFRDLITATPAPTLAWYYVLEGRANACGEGVDLVAISWKLDITNDSREVYLPEPDVTLYGEMAHWIWSSYRHYPHHQEEEMKMRMNPTFMPTDPEGCGKILTGGGLPDHICGKPGHRIHSVVVWPNGMQGPPVVGGLSLCSEHEPHDKPEPEKPEDAPASDPIPHSYFADHDYLLFIDAQGVPHFAGTMRNAAIAWTAAEFMNKAIEAAEIR